MGAGAKLTRGSIRRHLVSQTLPMIVGVAAIMSIGLVDAYFIGQLGSAELAAMAFIFPVGVALSSLGVGVSVGINSVVARALGSGDRERAARRANFGIVFAAMLGIVMGLSLYTLLDPLFALLQAQDELRPIIRSYMQPFALGFPLLMAIMGLNGTLRGQGEAMRTSSVSVIYAAANWILDPILITGAFGFEGLGMVGAAYATIIGWAFGVAAAWYHIQRTSLPFDSGLLRESDWLESARAILGIAGPAAFSNAINPIGLAVLTALLASQGQAVVAGFGAAGRLQSFAVVPLLGLSGSIGAIIGQNWGASLPQRSRRAMRYAAIFCLVYGMILATILVSGGRWFADFFSDDPAVIREFGAYLAIAAWGYAAYGLLIVSNGALNAVGKAQYALLQSLGRVFLIMLPCAWLLRPIWGENAIYAAELAANVLGGSVALFVVWRILRRDPLSVQ